MKHCNICDRDLPHSKFHKRAASNDGLAARCKECQADYDRARADRPDRVLLRLEYAKTDRYKASIKKNAGQWAKRNPLKRAAHIAVGNAIQRGKLKKQPCELCFSPEKVHAHHDDYSKPLEVRWFCIDCHTLIHRDEREQARLRKVWEKTT